MFLIETLCRKKRIVDLIFNFDFFLFSIKIKQQRIYFFCVHIFTAPHRLVWTAFSYLKQSEVFFYEKKTASGRICSCFN
nr:MAG TPA: hypothetical protein [Caudoviricetes sp.]